jgi:hypothetical protein
MNEVTRFLLSHEGIVLFLAVFLEQVGLPLPTVPWLVTAGALAASGRLSAWLARQRAHSALDYNSPVDFETPNNSLNDSFLPPVFSRQTHFAWSLSWFTFFGV